MSMQLVDYVNRGGGSKNAKTEEEYLAERNAAKNQTLQGLLSQYSATQLANAMSAYNTKKASTQQAYGLKRQAAQDAYDAQAKTLAEAYQIASDETKDAAGRQKKTAYVNLQKLLKYMPEYLQQQGLSGLGFSQSALVDAYGRYQGSLNDIDANTAQMLAKYDQQRLSSLAGYDQQRIAALANYDQQELSDLTNYDLQLISAQQNANDQYVNALLQYVYGNNKSKDGGSGSSSGETDMFSDDDTEDGQSGTSGSNVQVVGTDANGKGQGWNSYYGRNITVTLNGNSFKTEMGDALTYSQVNEVIDALGKEPKAGTVLQYNGDLVVVAKNGDMRYLKPESDMTNINRKNGTDKLKNYLLS